MDHDLERIVSIKNALQENRLDALVCTLPANVLLVSGYWPVVGTSVAVVTADRTLLLVPSDERDLAEKGWADEVRPFHPGSLDSLAPVDEVVRRPLADLVARVGPCKRVGYEIDGFAEPTSYAAMHLYGAAIVDLLRTTFAGSTLLPADDLLARLRAVKTVRELAKVRHTCALLRHAFASGAAALRLGQSDAVAAQGFQGPLFRGGRTGGFVWCMSGPDSARASGAFASTGHRTLTTGDFALIHCNSWADGFWTDVTRTWHLGQPDARARGLIDAVAAARAAALAVVAPGARAADVDAAARAVLTEHGYGAAFPHSTGHGVGFGAISALQRPRLHPCSDDILRPGMVFNVEPAIYLEGYGGIRHCDMVAITDNGTELLTPFQTSPGEWVLT